MAIVCGVPNAVQVTPSGEVKAEKTFPCRSNLTQTGANGADAVLVEAEVPPTAVRRIKRVPLDAVATTAACLEPPAVVSRISIPALALAVVLVIVATRAVIEPSPVRVCMANCISSAVPPISAPEPPRANVFVAGSNCETPVMPTVPIS